MLVLCGAWIKGVPERTSDFVVERKEIGNVGMSKYSYICGGLFTATCCNTYVDYSSLGGFIWISIVP